MTEMTLLAPVELTDAELDLVTGAANAVAGFGLANIALGVDNITVLSNHGIDINVGDVTLRDIASHNNVGVGALIQALGGVAVLLNRVA